MSETIIKALWDYFLTCPLMGNQKINVDYLPPECGRDGVEYCISPTPDTEILNRFVSGSTMRQYTFTLGSVNDYGTDTLQNIDNCGFYEAMAAWLEVQTQTKHFPTMPPGKRAMQIYALTPVYLLNAQETAGKYQIPCRIVYFQKGER